MPLKNPLITLLTSSALLNPFGGNAFAQFLRGSLFRPTPSYELTSLSNNTSVSLAGSGFDSSTTGGTVIFDFDFENWQDGGTQGIFQIGNSTSDYLSFFVTAAGVVRAIPRSSDPVNTGGVNYQDAQILRRSFDVMRLRSGSAHFRLGFTMLPSGQYHMTLNGLPLAYLLSGYVLPAIDETSVAQIGLLNGGSALGVGSGMTPNKVELYNTPLTADELQRATLVDDFIADEAYDEDEFTFMNFGQSNAHSVTANVAPGGYTLTATNVFNHRKDFTRVSYVSPFAQTPSALTDLANSGGWSWMDQVLNEKGNAEPNLKFAAVTGCESGIGFSYDGGSGKFDYTISGDSYIAPRYLVQIYLNLLQAYQRSNPFVFLIKGGETDGLTGSGVTTTSIKASLDRLYQSLKYCLGNAKVIVGGLHAQPSTGYANWSTSNTAQQEWATENNFDFVDGSAFGVNVDELHLSNIGQQELGDAVLALVP